MGTGTGVETGAGVVGDEPMQQVISAGPGHSPVCVDPLSHVAVRMQTPSAVEHGALLSTPPGAGQHRMLAGPGHWPLTVATEHVRTSVSIQTPGAWLQAPHSKSIGTGAGVVTGDGAGVTSGARQHVTSAGPGHNPVSTDPLAHVSVRIQSPPAPVVHGVLSTPPGNGQH